MLSVFQVFKIIMGLFIAGFFFYIILNFTGIYTWFQESQQEILIMQNFRDTVRNTYVYDIPAEFRHFENFEELRYDDPPRISSLSGDVSMDAPLFLKPGKNLYIYRKTLDLGWWRFQWVGALPAMKIVFNPLDYSQEHWSIMQDLAGIFPQSQDPRITLGFCTGNRELEGVERDYFISAIRQPRDLNFSLCTRDFPENYFLIIISSQDLKPSNGVLVKPMGNGTGYVYYRNNSFIYSDPLDILAILLGLDSLWGPDTLYRYKNTLLFSELQIAAKKEAERSELMRLNRRCVDTYGELGNILCSDENSICRLAESIMDSGYSDPGDFQRLSELNGQAEDKYRELEAEGCE